MKLTAHRRKILTEAVHNYSMCPGGSRRSLPYASQWWRAVKWLMANGLVTRPSGSSIVVATDVGRALVQKLKESKVADG